MNEKIFHQLMINFRPQLPPHVKIDLRQGVEELIQRMKNAGFSSVYTIPRRNGADIHFLLDDIEEGWIRVTKYRNNRTIINFSYVKSREIIDFILQVVKIHEILHSNTNKIELLIPKDETRILCVRRRISS